MYCLFKLEESMTHFCFNSFCCAGWTHPFFNAVGLTQGSFCRWDTVGDTAITFAKAPELSTHFLGKKA